MCNTLNLLQRALCVPQARKFGAEGVGLCRTEHMFFASAERIATVRRMIVAQSLEARQKALNDLLPFQRADFEGMFRAMEGCPVTIRLLDPPPARVPARRWVLVHVC